MLEFSSCLTLEFILVVLLHPMIHLSNPKNSEIISYSYKYKCHYQTTAFQTLFSTCSFVTLTQLENLETIQLTQKYNEYVHIKGSFYKYA